MSPEPDPTTRPVANSVTGDVSGVIVQAGTINGLHYHHPARPAVVWPYRFGHVPLRALSFQDREAGELVARVIGAGQTAVLTSNGPVATGVLSGLGGVGKTQLAADYARSAWAAGDLDLLVWITAGSREAILSAYASLAADLTGVDDPDPEQGARRLLAWLASTSRRWLLVLDDLRAPADLSGLWPPTSPGGRVVVTTRRRDAALRGEHRRLIEIDVFTPDEATAYLGAVLGERPALLEGAADLVATLGCLPLALAQAAAFMLDRDLSCADYGARFADQRRLESLMPEPEGLPDEHRATVAVTWSFSVEQANRLAPAGLAGPLLEIASLLDANGIPITVFTAGPVLAWLSERIGHPVGGEQARDGLGCLHRLSLIAWDRDSAWRAVRVHALVQRATRDRLLQHRLGPLVRVVADALLDVWPSIERDTTVGVLRANAEALITAGGDQLWVPDGHDVLFRAGISLFDVGLASEARDYFHRLYAAANNHLGPDHLHTLATRYELARSQGVGSPAVAASAFEELLADDLRVLGPDHHLTLNTRSNLAYWRGMAGNPAEAAVAFEELLADYTRVLGPDHFDTLNTRYELARSRSHGGDPAVAASAFEELLADDLRVLGPDHHLTLNTRSNLAYWRGMAGNPAEAAVAFEELLADYTRVLGPDHFDTLNTRYELAQLQGDAGDPAKAVAALEQVLTDRVHILGRDHPHTRQSRDNLAYWKKRLSDPDR